MNQKSSKELPADSSMQSGVVPSFTQIKSMTTEIVPNKEGSNIKRIHDQLNENAKPFQEMFNSLENEQNKIAEAEQVDLIDPFVLNKVQF